MPRSMPSPVNACRRLSRNRLPGRSAERLSIQPRRVQTLTVRADGTLVQSDQAKAEAGAQADGAQAGPLANQAAAEGSAAAKVADQLAAKTNSVEPVKVATVRVRTNQAGGQAGAEGAAKIDAAQAGQSAGAANEVKTASLQDDGASLARGEWAVQVSSQRTPEEAQAAYKNLRNKFPDLLEGRQMAVQRADLGDKGTFYRVRITAPNKEDAGKFCDSLKAAGGSCFVTR